jgi:hypothetical protein
MGADDGGVQHHPFQIRFGGDRLEDAVQHTHPDPTIVALLGPFIRPKPLGQVAPAPTGSGHPQQSINEQPTVAAKAALTLAAAWHERLDSCPLIVPKNFAFQSCLLKAALNHNQIPM